MPPRGSSLREIGVNVQARVLELHTKAQLDPTAAAGAVRRDKLRGDHAKILQSAGQRKTPSAGAGVWIAVRYPWIAIDYVIEDIEKVGRETQSQPLRYRRRLANGRIQIPMAEAPERIRTPRPSIRR